MEVNRVHKILTVKVKENISTERKLDLIGLTILQSDHDNIINPMLLDIFFKVNMVLIYTNIEVSEEEKLDKVGLYDFFKKNSLWENFVKEMEVVYPGEIEYMQDSLNAWVEEYKSYSNSTLAIIDVLKDYLDNLIKDFSQNAQTLKDVDWSSLGEINKIAETFQSDLDSEKE